MSANHYCETSLGIQVTLFSAMGREDLLGCTVETLQALHRWAVERRMLGIATLIEDCTTAIPREDRC